MKFRLTPLNIVSAIMLVTVGYLLLNADPNGWRLLGSVPILVLALISFIADLIFRRFLLDIKRIWIIELLFIIFVAILIILFTRI
jgi:hypothetical protein